MANNDYFYSNQRPPASSPSPAQTFDPRFAPSPMPSQSHSNLTPAPPYHPGESSYSTPSHTAGHYDAQHSQLPPVKGQTGPSPFDTVFDDHMYPTNSRQNLAPTPDQMSYQGSYGDPGYLGYGRQSPDGRSHTEDIPLQDQPGKYSAPPGMDDHIYDDPSQNGGRRRKRKQRKVGLGELGMFGADRKGIPWVVYFFSAVQIAVFLAEIIKNGIMTGSPIMIHPQFNPMIGPSTQVMINMGARYTPCMHNVQGIQDSNITVEFLCPNATKNDQFCPLSELCGFGGVPNPIFDGQVTSKETRPNQWFRFITPIFMHAGLIHIGFNLLLQLTLGKDMERAIGPVRFVLVYLSAGIFGFVMGGNFAAPGIASTGASGSLFGIIALTLVDLLYSWKERKNPVKDLMLIIVDMVISFVLGLLPGLDNFSHIGGFLMGLALGICVLHSPNSLRRRLGEDPTDYESVPVGSHQGALPFYKNPVGFFKGRKPLWWAWWLVRAAALVGIIVVFIVLLNKFYTSYNTCHWCKYLSCLPVSNWCDLGTIKETSS